MNDKSYRYSLLSDRLLTVRSPGRKNPRKLTLPEVLNQLGEDGGIGDFPNVASHQKQPLHAFLVQLAAIALHRAEKDSPKHSAEEWHDMLLDLVQGNERAFSLIVDDLSSPAFLQPPVPEGNLSQWGTTLFPEQLDRLVAAKAHDLKSQRAHRAEVEHWMFALLSLQTMDGYIGRKYGIARMNGGSGSRAATSVCSALDPGSRFRKDTVSLLRERESVAETFGFAREDGVSLVWLEPWDGKLSLGLDRCDPYFIEVCRRVRLRVHEGSRLAAYDVRTDTTRIRADERRGVLGDPWLPVASDGEKALTVKKSGFNYSLVQGLLFGTHYNRPIAQRQTTTNSDGLFFLAQVLVRGEGVKSGTHGYHERLLAIGDKLTRRLVDSSESSNLGEISEVWVKRASLMRTKVLRPAVLTLLQGGPEKLNQSDERANPELDRFETVVDRRFFDVLFAAIEAAGDSLETLKDNDSVWCHELLSIAEATFEEAIARVSIPEARFYRAVALARRVFYGAAKNNGFARGVGKAATLSQRENAA